MTVLVVVCALLLTSLIVGLALGAFIRTGQARPHSSAHNPAPTIYKAPACAWCGCRGWHAVDCRLAEAL